MSLKLIFDFIAISGIFSKKNDDLDIENLDLDNKDDCYEFPVYAITSGAHDVDGDQKVYIEPSILNSNIEAFNELPVYYNHQRTPDDLLGVAVNPEYVELDDVAGYDEADH